MGTHSYFPIITILVLLTILAIFGMKYFSTSRQYASQAKDGEKYKSVLHELALSQKENTLALNALLSDMAEVKTKINDVEKILRDVE